MLYASEILNHCYQLQYRTPVKEAIKKALNDDDFFATYAGGDGFCGECFEVENNQLRSVSIGNYVDDIAKYIDKNWRD